MLQNAKSENKILLSKVANLKNENHEMRVLIVEKVRINNEKDVEISRLERSMATI